MAGLEFALLSPVLLALFLGTIDLSGALLTARRMEIAAGSVAEIGTTGAAQTQALNVLTDVQAWQATTAAFALFPGWTPAGCTQNCKYNAAIVWSVANELGAKQLRACGPLTSVPDAEATSYTTLPASNFGPTSLLVADISYTFQPIFFGFLIGNIPMMQSAYVSPRIGNGIQLLAAGGKGVNVSCPGAN
jgi:Flp pilus assembly protein TadG